MAATRPPTDPTVRSRWTPKDEALLNELQQRRESIIKQNREPIVEAVLNGGPVESAIESSRLVEWLIANAQLLRKLLEPFDEGTPEVRS